MKNDEIILMGHGSGGRLMRELLADIFLKHFGNIALATLSDASAITMDGTTLAFTTDSYVIDPVFFPGGDIGKLAISGTVNDLCVSGAIPRFISCGFIIEEGFAIKDLEKIVVSMAGAARDAGVSIVTGDTKVVKHGQCDKIYINTSGIGYLPPERAHTGTGKDIQPGDKIIVSGTLGDHAMAILAARNGLTLHDNLVSDTMPLNHLTEKILGIPQDIKFMRDITRGGLATVLAEICTDTYFGIEIEERNIPVKQVVRSLCELYGFDPLYLANEGKMVIVVRQGAENRILQKLQTEDAGKNAAIIGEITGDHKGMVVLRSIIGGDRIVDMLNGEILPRIC